MKHDAALFLERVESICNFRGDPELVVWLLMNLFDTNDPADMGMWLRMKNMQAEDIIEEFQDK